MPDWTKLHPLRGDRRYAFEELTFQIAKVLYANEGQFIRVDDVGGGDGVEFYLRRPDGTEWGWQTKFFPGVRLTHPRRTQVIQSLRRACEVHPALREWVLCTPMNFTPAEQAWFDADLPQVIPAGMNVQLRHWSESDYAAWLAEPRFGGKTHFFFGELELNLEWFNRQFDRQTASLRDLFNPGLHTETELDSVVHNLLGDQEFGEYVDNELSSIDGQIDELKDTILRLERDSFPEIEWGAARDELILSSTQLLDAVTGMRRALADGRAYLAGREFTAIRNMDFKSAEEILHAAYEAYIALVIARGPYNLGYLGEESRRDSVVWRAYKTVAEPANLAEFLQEELVALQRQFAFLKESELHVFGAGGVGKTHLACHICEQRLRNGLPALYVRGARFRSDDSLETQLRNVFDIPPSYAWGDFVEALATAAEVYETKIPIVIDGLNEAVRHGRFSTVWETDLPGIAADLSSEGRLALLTTCRPTYRAAIWKNGGPSNHFTLTGFDDDIAEQAIAKYFEWYKITADTTLASLSPFRLPIYLRVFCEITNRSRENDVEAYVGQQSLFEVFEVYLSRSNEAVSQNLGKHPAAAVATTGLKNLAEYMWNNQLRIVSLDEGFHAVDSQSLPDINIESSLTQHLLDEGLLIERDRYGEEEGIQFTFDLMGGT